MTQSISYKAVARRPVMKTRVAIVIIISIIAASVAPVATFAAPKNGKGQTAKRRKLSAELESVRNSSTVKRVIIQTKGAPSAAHDEAIQSKGGRRHGSFESFQLVVADVPGTSLTELASRDDISYISDDKPVRAHAALVTESTGAAQVQAGAPGAPALDGKGVTIAILDSGISANHPDFAAKDKSRVVASVDFTGSTATGDPFGHGTAVAATAAGTGAASND